ncbi:MAG TPA: glucodextranase DOMON-like domain-containing protein [Steroidobacteraceae bacterium]|nr:glucodextranase DOMON-like domain-containing protein [Steroidobacteraceae bacterium]
MRERARQGRTRRGTTTAAGVCCALAWLAASAEAVAAEPLFVLQDARGDDDGNGSLIYPNRDDLEPGDLDLVSLHAEQRSDGIWFVVEMGQAIRSPVGRVTELGQTPIERIARNGFYTFNVDVYVDTDRIAGSGQTGTVPGRAVTVDRQFAWEKALVLTPRPDIARTMLQLYFDSEFESELRAKQGKVSKDELRDLQSQSERRVNDLFYFPTRVRVSGRQVEFLVPQEFLGGVPSKSWGYTVVVTGADIEQTGRPGQLTPVKPTMMTMGVARGVRWSQWGIRGDADEATPPVIDILAADHDVQKTALSDYDAVSGRLAAVPGVAPDGQAAMAGSGQETTPEQLVRIEAATQGGTGTAGSTPTERRTVPARLRTLNELLADGLITQAEYNELRRKILAEL